MTKSQLASLKSTFSSDIENSEKLKLIKVLVQRISYPYSQLIFRQCFSIINKEMCQNTPFLSYCQTTLLNPTAMSCLNTADLIILAYLLKCLQDFNKTGENLKEESYQGALAELYVRLIVDPRNVIPENIAELSAYILQSITIPKIREVILPQVKKAMLRNPEISIFNVKRLFTHILLFGGEDNVQWLNEILLPLLISSNEEISNQAVQIFDCSQQLRDVSVDKLGPNFAKITLALMQFYKSPLCKQITPKVKGNVLDAIKNVANSCLAFTQTFKEAKSEILPKLMDLIESETHEALVLRALDALVAWIECLGSLSHMDHDALLLRTKDFLQNGLVKSKSQLIKIKFLELSNAILSNSQNLPRFEFLLPIIIKLGESITQSANPYFSLMCINIILTLTASSEIKNEGALKANLKAGLTCLQREKMLVGPSTYLETNLLMAYLQYVRLALKHYTAHIGSNDLNTLGRALVAIASSAKCLRVRQAGLTTIRESVLSLQPLGFGVALLKQLKDLLIAYHQASNKRLDENKSSGEALLVVNYVYHCLSAICFATPDVGKRLASKDKESFLLHVLLVSTYPTISNSNRPFMKSVLRRYQVTPSEFVTKSIASIIKEIMPEQCDALNIIYSEVWCREIIKVLIGLSPKITINKIVPHLLETMNDSVKYTLSNEVFTIYNTPPNTLCNRKLYTDIVEGLQNTKLPGKPPNKLNSIKDAVEREEMKKNWEIYHYLLDLNQIFVVDSSNKLDPTLEKYLDHKQKATLVDEYLREQTTRNGLDKDLEEFKLKAHLIACIFARPESQQLARFFDDLASCFVWHIQKNPLTSKYVQPLMYQMAQLIASKTHFFLGCKMATLVIAVNSASSSGFSSPGFTLSTYDDLSTLPSLVDQINIIICKDSEAYPGSHSAILDFSYFMLDDPRNLVLEKQRMRGNDNIMPMIETYVKTLNKHLEPVCTGDAMGQGKTFSYKPKILPRLRLLQIAFKIMALGYDNLDQLAHQLLRLLVDFNAVHPVTETTKNTLEEISLILKNSSSPQPMVREICLSLIASYKECLAWHFKNQQRSTSSSGLTDSMADRVWQDLTCSLWIAKFDVADGCKLLADRIWQECKVKSLPKFCQDLLIYSIATPEYMHAFCGQSIANYLNTCPEQNDPCVDLMISLYQEKHKPLPAQHDEFGRSLGILVHDDFNARRCLATIITHLVTDLEVRHKTDALVFKLFSFIIGHGLRDRDGETQDLMLKAALAIIKMADENVVLGDKFVEAADKKLLEAPLSAEYDDMRRGLVILLGHLAKNIGAGDPRIESIFTKLISALNTPSQSVQESVGSCLVIITPSLSPTLVDAEFDKFWATTIDEKSKFAVRKGAAYGIAGLSKGFGLAGIKRFGCIDRLETALADKKNSRRREGALFVIESLTRIYGKQMEPYALAFMSTLLNCFGDGLGYVRDSAQDAFKAITSCLTSHGINLLIPILTEALSNDAWRTQTASIEMLGSMSHCAPDQLSSCLPTIVPKLVDTLSNSHDKVRDSGALALRSIGSVMQNPEIRERVDILIDAMKDPDTKSASCLKTLLGTRLFVHAIDTASLALLMPVVQRTMQDRSSEIRRMALNVLADMFDLTSESDVKPYLPALLPRMKVCLVDPLPEVRSQASHALGNLVGVVDKSLVDQLVAWLTKTLVSETSAVDRSGAAQGLSMMVHKLGIARLDSILVDVIQTLHTPNLPSPVKDGYLLMLLYLPSVFKDDFIPYLDKIVPSLLLGLADESEYVRETGIKAGKRIISIYSVPTMSTFLPEIERGLLVPNWRIRYSSVQLIGELLFNILGVTGKMTTVSEEDETFASEAATEVLSQTLGLERQNKILSALYICTCDTRDEIAAASLHIWKIVVHNTARMLKQVLTQLIPFILAHISSTQKELITIAARTIGQVVRKLEGVLPEFLSILRQRFDASLVESHDKSSYEIRRGVCFAIKEILSNASRDMVNMYNDAIDHILSTGLGDSEPSVREAAVLALDKYHQVCGQRMFDNIIPHLLHKIEKEGETNSGLLDGLKELVVLKSRAILPFIIPKLGTDYAKCAYLYELLAFSSEGSLDKYGEQVLPRMLAALEAMIKNGQLDVELYLSPDEISEDQSDVCEHSGRAEGGGDIKGDGDVSVQSDVGEGIDGEGENLKATDSIREILGLFESEEAEKYFYEQTVFASLKTLDPSFAYTTPLESDDSPAPIPNALCLAGLVMLHMHLLNGADYLDIDEYRLCCVKALLPTLKSRDIRVVRLTSDILEIIFEALKLPLQGAPPGKSGKFGKARRDDNSEEDESSTNGESDASSEETSDSDDTEAIRECCVALKNFARSWAKDVCAELPGLQLFPEALLPLRTLAVEKGMLNPDFGVKEQAVQSALELVKVSPPSALKPVILKFMGPVLRLLTQRYSPSFRATLLQICAALLYKNKASLKAFVPQLQATFFKALKDQDFNVRVNGARGLAHLMSVHPKPINVYNELLLQDGPHLANGDSSYNGDAEANFSHETPEYREINMKKTMLYALRLAIPETSNMGDVLAKSIQEKLIPITQCIVNGESMEGIDLACFDDENKRIAMGSLGALCQHFSKSQFLHLLSNYILRFPLSKDEDDVGYDVCLYVIAKKCPVLLTNLPQADPMIWKQFMDQLNSYLLPDSKINAAISTVKMLNYLATYYINNNVDIPEQLLSLSTKAIVHKSHDVKMLAINLIHYHFETNPHLGSSLANVAKRSADSLLTGPVKAYVQNSLAILARVCNDGNSIVRNQGENVLIRILSIEAHTYDAENLKTLLDDANKSLLEEVKLLVERTLQKKIQSKKGSQVKITIKPWNGLMLEQCLFDESVLN